jgi:hypothetical protein
VGTYPCGASVVVAVDDDSQDGDVPPPYVVAFDYDDVPETP